MRKLKYKLLFASMVVILVAGVFVVYLIVNKKNSNSITLNNLSLNDTIIDKLDTNDAYKTYESKILLESNKLPKENFVLMLKVFYFATKIGKDDINKVAQRIVRKFYLISYENKIINETKYNKILKYYESRIPPSIEKDINFLVKIFQSNKIDKVAGFDVFMKFLEFDITKLYEIDQIMHTDNGTIAISPFLKEEFIAYADKYLEKDLKEQMFEKHIVQNPIPYSSFEAVFLKWFFGKKTTKETLYTGD